MTWDLPWSVPEDAIRVITWVLLLVFGTVMVWAWFRNRGKDPSGLLFAAVLYSVLVLPHMARYNHVVALPAIAWLWRRGQRAQGVTMGAYTLFALSRLNHLWAILLPAPIGPFATGLGLFSVLLLLIVVCSELRCSSVE